VGSEVPGDGGGGRGRALDVGRSRLGVGHSAGIGTLAATTELNGTPVALGYWVDRILPSQSAPIEAPGSAATAQQNNQPLEPVAITARPGGGVYMAYCTATSTQQCGHIDLWKVGSSSVKVVPGSHNSRSTRVALAADPQGRLSVIWYDATKNVIHAVRTNTSATAFGAIRTIKPPPKTFGFNSIQAQGSSGRLDVLIVDQLSTTSGSRSASTTRRSWPACRLPRSRASSATRRARRSPSR
jgi:hypothetical protein